MNDRVEGAAREFGTRAQDTAENVAGDKKAQAEGLYNQAAGQAQQATAQFSDVIKSQPVVSILVAVAVGYILGRLTA
jgi:uncharacterized protein YjbJ (UPF0337 family)